LLRQDLSAKKVKVLVHAKNFNRFVSFTGISGNAFRRLKLTEQNAALSSRKFPRQHRRGLKSEFLWKAEL